MSIPIGSSTDHPLVNVMGEESQDLAAVEMDPILVVVGGGDLLKDRAVEYVEKLEKQGKKIELVEFEGNQHGFFTIDPNSEASNQLMQFLKQFIEQNSR